MKKYLVMGVIVLVLIYAVIAMLSPAPEIGENSSESDQTGVTAKITKGLKSILPEDTDPNLGKHEDSAHVVVIKPSENRMTADDVVDRIELLKDKKEHEALDFARWSMFSENAKYSTEEKERFLETALEVLSTQESRMLLNDVLLIGNRPALYDKALTTVGQGMTPDELKSFVQEFLKRNPNAEAKAAVINYAASRNLYVK